MRGAHPAPVEEYMTEKAEVLEGSVERNEKLSHFAGLAVVVGVAVEVVLAFAFMKSWGEAFGVATANALVAVGVYLELHFNSLASNAQKELKRQSDEKIAAANKAAAEANLKAEELRAKNLVLERAIFGGDEESRKQAIAMMTVGGLHLGHF